MEEVQGFVGKKFGNDKDLERTIRFMMLALLYEESKGSLELMGRV